MNWSKISLFIGLIPFFSSAQAPQKISYQAVIRNANNSLVVSKAIGLRISILNGAIKPVTVYEETQQTFTNAFGLVSIQIGAGKASLGEMSEINWGKGEYFIKTEIDPNGGANYVLSGLTELTSVPYALFALTSGVAQETAGGGGVPGPQGERGLTGETGIQGTMGSTGLNGLNGSDGVDGINGAAGIAGTTGIAGAIGLTGLRGAQGSSGTAGDVGPSGAIGLTGIQGPAGSNGVAGPQGLIGRAGDVGITGPQGPAGNDGLTGINGLDGTNGSDGTNGVDGNNGPIGATGPSGPTGARGLIGNPGAIGPQGVQGIQGSQGNPGADGVYTGKFNKSQAPILFDKDIVVTPEEIFNAGIFISTSRDPTLVNLPNISDLLKIVPERATTGDIITFLIGSIDTIITMQPGEGGSIAGPATINAGQTRVVYIRILDVESERPTYFVY